MLTDRPNISIDETTREKVASIDFIFRSVYPPVRSSERRRRHAAAKFSAEVAVRSTRGGTDRKSVSLQEASGR
jgi:hypothetical protein